MILNEDEARKKQCCGPEGCGVVKVTKGSDGKRLCVGVSCMAWNFLTPGQAAGIQNQRGAVHEPFKAGFCGLAFKP